MTDLDTTHTHACPRCHGTGRVADQRLSLSDDQRAEILTRLSWGARAKDLAEEFHVNPSTISRIRHNVGPRQ